MLDFELQRVQANFCRKCISDITDLGVARVGSKQQDYRPAIFQLTTIIKLSAEAARTGATLTNYRSTVSREESRVTVLVNIAFRPRRLMQLIP